MARVTVKTNFEFGRVKRFRRRAAKQLAGVLKTAVLREIRQGRSPVRGGKRFQRYSDSYRDQIRKNDLYKALRKRRSPVNLTLSGELLDSIFAKVTKRGVIFLGFSDRLADIHNRRGAGRSKVVRRMLPTNKGERFNRVIGKDIDFFLAKARNRLIQILNK